MHSGIKIKPRWKSFSSLRLAEQFTWKQWRNYLENRPFEIPNEGKLQQLVLGKQIGVRIPMMPWSWTESVLGMKRGADCSCWVLSLLEDHLSFCNAEILVNFTPILH